LKPGVDKVDSWPDESGTRAKTSAARPAGEVGEACILGFEPECSLLVGPLAEQVQAITGERDIVRGEGEQQALR
jgi:hypothetical protein